MRKQYCKPMLFAETFQLVDHIAGSCGGVDSDAAKNEGYSVSWHSASNCSLTIPDGNGGSIVLFANAGNNCIMPYLPEEFQGDKMVECYNNMSSSYNYFAS